MTGMSVMTGMSIPENDSEKNKRVLELHFKYSLKKCCICHC